MANFNGAFFVLLFWKVLETGHETVELCLFDQPPRAAVPRFTEFDLVLTRAR